jgi:hypothetical protein
MAAWSKYSDQVPVPRRQKRKGKEKTHRANKEGSRDSSLPSSNVKYVHKEKNIQNPLKKEKEGNSVRTVP